MKFMSTTKSKPIKEQYNIHTEMKNQRLQAIEIAKTFVHIKPIKYLTK
jgi:hypothetical protein